MKKYIILSLALCVSVFTVNAQEEVEEKKEEVVYKKTSEYSPVKNDFTVAILFGRGQFANGGLAVPSGTYVNGTAPYANDVDANSNSISNMIGAEMRYFKSHNFAYTLSVGAILRSTPSSLNIASVTGVGTATPTYAAVVAKDDVAVNATIGGQWILKNKNGRLFPYIGFAIPFDYARVSLYDPTVNVNTNTTNNPVTFTNPNGTRHADITTVGIQFVAGADYYLAKDVYFGFDIKPVSYSYAFGEKSPGASLLTAEANTYTLSFFAQFAAKIGFKF